MLNHSSRILSALTIAAAVGCGSAPKQVVYARAVPISDEPPSPPRATSLGTSAAYSGQSFATRLPPAPPTAAPQAKQLPREVINHAYQTSVQEPQSSTYVNALHEYTFVEGTPYRVYAAPLRVTDVALEPGELIQGTVAFGDPVNWKSAFSTSQVNGLEQQHLWIKPMHPGMTTNAIVNTDKRTYHIDLISYETTSMLGVYWRYPQDEMAKLAAQARQAAATRRTATPVSGIANLRFGYKLAGDETTWRPTQVFDDGRRTFIVFPPTMRNREAPVLFVVSSSGDSQLVNYTVKGTTYIVQRLFDEAELVLGQSDPERVRIIAPR